jgi:hypothetical protein
LLSPWPLGFALGRIRRPMMIDQRQEKAVRRRAMVADRHRMIADNRAKMAFAL